MTREWKTAWYEDKEETRLVDTVNFGVVEEGEIKDMVLYLKNREREQVFMVQYYSNNHDLKITGSDHYLPGQIRPVYFKWITSPDGMVLNDDVHVVGRIIRSHRFTKTYPE